MQHDQQDKMKVTAVKPPVSKPARKPGAARPGKRWRWAILLGLALGLTTLAAVWFKKAGAQPALANGNCYAARRGDLVVEVTESGSVIARDPVEIISQVEGRATILSIVPEGTYITQEDVDKGKILVELDASEIKEARTKEEIQFHQAEASFTEARENYEIQLKQNESDVKTSELKEKFALMDLQKYLGEEEAALLVKGTDENPAFKMSDLIVDPNRLGGEALQKYNGFNSKISLAQEELKQAESTLGWTRKLYEKQYVPRTELEGDELKTKRSTVAVDQAKMDLDLYTRYEFLKQSEKLLSDYQEAGRELERTRKKAKAQLAQTEAKLRSTEAQFKLQQEQLDKLNRQLAACIIKAPAPGLIVYNKNFGYNREVIEPGAVVRERQKLITMPNSAAMAVEVKIHESWMAKVKNGQTAQITIEPLPDRTFTGRVTKVSPMPDQQNFWMNPDLKVYATEVSIDGEWTELRSGMSAKVCILVDERPEVIYVPMQAVTNQNGQKVCYVETGSGTLPRPITTGAFNDSYIEVAAGLREGELVLLTPPRVSVPQVSERRERKEESPEKPPETASETEDKLDKVRAEKPVDAAETANISDKKDAEKSPPRGGEEPSRRPGGSDAGREQDRTRGERQS